MKAKFPDFEGIDGAGKTTVALRVFQWLDKRGISAIYNEEPTKGPFGQMINFILTGQMFPPELPGAMERLARQVAEREVNSDAMRHFWAAIMMTIQNLRFSVRKGISGDSLKNFLNPFQEQSLFFADRFFDVRDIINPALQKGIWPVQDRYELSSGAYLIARGGTPQQFLELRESALGGLYRPPDLTFFIKTPPEVAMARMEKAGKKRDRNETLEHLRKVATAYDQLIDFLNSSRRTYPVVFIDGSRSEEEVFNEVVHRLEGLVEPTPVTS